MRDRILVLDGATGTYIQGLDLTAADFGGPEYEGCNEHLVLTRPDAVLGMHRAYLQAGADIVETNTFGGTPLVLAEYGLAERAREINARAAQLARQACGEVSTPGRPRFVAGSMGPTTKAISVTGGITFDGMLDTYRVQALGLVEGGADFLLVETIQDTLNGKAALLGVDAAFEELGRAVPVALSCTIEPMGTMLAGQSIDSFYASVEHRDLLYVGLNCSTGPRFMTDHLRTLAGIAECPVACMPNAGLPDEDGRYNETPEMIAEVLAKFAGQGWLNLAGGCCGTDAAYVRAIAAAVGRHQPRTERPKRFARVSGVDFQTLEEERRPLLVGERTNVIGSRNFKKLIADGDFERASEIGRAQVRGGAHIVDVCLADPDRDERTDLETFLAKLVRKVRVPIMIDSTDAEVIEAALKLTQGKSLINSVNLEDGEERFERVVPLARTYGAALIVGCIDDDPQQGMAVSAGRKIDVARRAYGLLTEKYGMAPEDLVFDPLVFPCGTGDPAYRGSAAQTIEGVRRIREAFPRSRTILGISNVSFGLPVAGREVLNSVFLYHCTVAGLDLAIVNSEKLVRFAAIPGDERKLCEDLLFDRGEDPVAAFAAHFKGRKAEPRDTTADRARPVETRLAAHVVDGSRERLEEDLDEAMGRYAPLDIINGPLMDGMNEVGRLFNTNQLIVAEVLQSAEVMKAAVTHLEPHMEKADTRSRGTVMLATVKGDVHDIGKNLVDIILSNNGYKVVNLGIKVEPARLIEGAREHRPDIVGLSGLLVKSAQQMVVTAADLREAGVRAPLLVGGAALTRKFTDTRIQPEYGELTAYAKDAMQGLDLANRIMDPAQRPGLEIELEAVRASYGAAVEAAPVPEEKPFAGRSVPPADEVPSPPDLRRHEVRRSVGDLLPYVNPMMLYGKHLGLRGMVIRLIEHRDEKALKLVKVVEQLVAECERDAVLDPRAVYRFYAARAEGEELVLSETPGGPAAARFRFPRQADRDRLCVADWVEPAGGRQDFVAMFVTTAGSGVRARAEALKAAGDYLRCHALQALALETAEAFAEWLHQQLRAAWGFADPADLTMTDRFKARYRGIRVSFGYPACPDLEQQAGLFAALKPETIGVKLTDGFMMEPEASVSALVFHHPGAKYFAALPGAAVGQA
ncbi:MAG: methionine synthase [Candidatus Eisenbacteria bacterium]|nr:methionine synthase [Candidatus Eisenbacteria bacterium]